MASVAGRLLEGGTRALRVTAIRATGRSRHKVISLRALRGAGTSLVRALSSIVQVRVRNHRGERTTRVRVRHVRRRLGEGLLRVEWLFDDGL